MYAGSFPHGYLPDSYTYRHHGLLRPMIYGLSVLNIENRTNAEKWLQKYAEGNKYTWRVLKTFPKTRTGVLFKVCDKIVYRDLVNN